MATITTYSELLVQIGAYLARSDFTAQAPVWVTLASNKINRVVKATAMETKNATFSITGEYVAVPTDFLEVRSFRITSTTDDVALEFKPDDQMTIDHLTTGTPGYFCVVGSNFRFGPAPDATYTATLTYFAKPAALVVSTAETNSLFPTHADLYLYGALLESTAQYGDNPNIAKWQAGFEAAVEQINKSSNRSRWGGNSMTTRPG